MSMKPLEGIKVIELGTHVAVPKCTRLMADWGAEVIKVEPLTGEAWRGIGRAYMLPFAKDNNVIFQAENANKKSIALDLKSPEGKDALVKLIASADIFVTNTRPVPLKKLGLDYETIQKQFPKLIYAHFSGFGEKGPDKDRPGAVVDWSLGDGYPFKPTAGFGDGTVGSALLSGILAALFNRTRTGQGELIQASLYGTALWYNSSGLLQGQEKHGHKYPKMRENSALPLGVLYKTGSGDWLLIAEANWDGKCEGVFKLLGLDHLVGDERFSKLENARKNMKELIGIFEEAFAKYETAYIMEGFAAMNIVHEKLAHPAEVCKDPQAWENGYLYEQTMENGEKVVLPTTPVKFGSYEEMPYALAPQLGADSVDVLKAVGYSEEEIAKLAENKAVGVQ